MIVEILGKFYDNHSLSIVNRNLAKSLSKANINLQIISLDSYDKNGNLSEEDLALLKSLENKKEVPDIQLRHFYPPIWSWPKYDITKVVYIQPWEFPKVPFEWQYKFETFADALIVPSNEVYKTFYSGGINPKNLYAIHNGYDETLFNTEKEADSFIADKEKFTFLFVGNGQWRKGLDLLLNSWPKAFVKADNVELIIKDNSSIYGKNNILNEIVKLQYKSGCGSIKYINNELSDKDMSRLYKSAECVVHPYRAEGFGMHVQEAVACGCVPIVPDKGPTEEFIPPNIGYRIATNKIAVDISDPKIFALKPGDSCNMMNSHTFMNEPDINSLVNGLRALYHQHNRQNYIDNMSNVQLLNTWDNIAQNYIKALKEINITKGVRRIK